jgi:cytochrome c-type biogenesis protein CcmH/NrfF
MCVQCGTPLAVSEAPSADRERALIRTLVDRGWTKAQIERKLVAEYGPNVLATPSNHGFDVSNWLVPVLLAVAALGGIAFTVRRWRRAGAAASAGEPAPAALAEPDAQRLERDMATYDL